MNVNYNESDEKKLNFLYDRILQLEYDVKTLKEQKSLSSSTKDVELKTENKKIRFVVCKNRDEFRSMHFRPSPFIEYKFIDSIDVLRGIENPDVLFVGKWIDNTLIQEIIRQIKVSTR